ncbi:MAG TPA: GNAT family N-acetyltransferase [Vicinamibacterales bacterium]
MTPFDLLTTLDDDAKRNVERIPFAKWIARVLLRPRAVFAGTTVSEYAIYPACENFIPLTESLLREMKSCRAELAIFKDVPRDSPLLSAEENQGGSRLLEACRTRGFIVLEGQALAYVSMDFKTEDEYLARFSGKRRYDIRRKLKSRSTVRQEEVPTGDSRFDDDGFVSQLYAMYEEVFAQSDVHFDKLTRDFFADVFRDASSGGIVFFYRTGEKLIGWKLCFVCRGNIVDKYVGFVYPDARDANIYFLSWFHCLEFAIRNGLRNYVVGWTDPKVKAYLGAKFNFTKHAVYLRNPLFRFVLKRCQRFFEHDKNLGINPAAAED